MNYQKVHFIKSYIRKLEALKRTMNNQLNSVNTQICTQVLGVNPRNSTSFVNFIKCTWYKSMDLAQRLINFMNKENLQDQNVKAQASNNKQNRTFTSSQNSKKSIYKNKQTTEIQNYASSLSQQSEFSQAVNLQDKLNQEIWRQKQRRQRQLFEKQLKLRLQLRKKYTVTVIIPKTSGYVNMNDIFKKMNDKKQRLKESQKLKVSRDQFKYFDKNQTNYYEKIKGKSLMQIFSLNKNEPSIQKNQNISQKIQKDQSKDDLYKNKHHQDTLDDDQFSFSAKQQVTKKIQRTQPLVFNADSSTLIQSSQQDIQCNDQKVDKILNKQYLGTGRVQGSNEKPKVQQIKQTQTSLSNVKKGQFTFSSLNEEKNIQKQCQSTVNQCKNKSTESKFELKNQPAKVLNPFLTNFTNRSAVEPLKQSNEKCFDINTLIKQRKNQLFSGSNHFNQILNQTTHQIANPERKANNNSPSTNPTLNSFSNRQAQFNQLNGVHPIKISDNKTNNIFVNNSNVVSTPNMFQKRVQPLLNQQKHQQLSNNGNLNLQQSVHFVLPQNTISSNMFRKTNQTILPTAKSLFSINPSALNSGMQSNYSTHLMDQRNNNLLSSLMASKPFKEQTNNTVSLFGKDDFDAKTQRKSRINEKRKNKKEQRIRG